MTPIGAPSRATEEFWRDFLSGGHSTERAFRRVLRLIPSNPRCRLCAAPFSGVGAPLMRLIGKAPSAMNPTLCSTCFTFMREHHGGAEVECSLLFADVRGSTAMAEELPPAAFRELIERFYAAGTDVVFRHEGLVDKFVGDELVAIFVPLLTGERHAEHAVAAARALLEATGHSEHDGPWVPVGAGVHSGSAWIGAVGSHEHTELTALGDAVNTAARLGAAAGTGEVLVSASAAAAAGLDAALERRQLELKGKRGATEVAVLAVGPSHS